MRVLFLICGNCGHQANVPWPMERTTLRDEILPRTRCAVCRQPASDMRIVWAPTANALHGAGTEKEAPSA